MSTVTKAAPKKVAPKKNAAKDLEALFKDSLKDIYWAEKAVSKEMPKMHKNATQSNLKSAIEKHMSETKTHIERLEKCFEAMGIKPQAKKCDAMQGLIDEAKSIMEETEPGSVRDAGIIAAIQKSEHYEIATYGTLAAFAKVLGYKKCVDHLVKTLEEEKRFDEKLTGIADTPLNEKAV